MSAGRRRWMWGAAGAAAAIAAASFIGLIGLAVWFLSAVTLAGGAAALGFTAAKATGALRLLALARPALKYAERLIGHRAALDDQTVRRRALFGALATAPKTREAGWQLDRLDRLNAFVDDVADVDFGRLRATLPAAVALGCGAALGVASLALTLAAGVLILVGAGGVGYLMRRRIDTDMRQSIFFGRIDRTIAADGVGAALAATAALTAEGRRPARLAAAAGTLKSEHDHGDRARRAAAALDAAVGLFCPLAGLAVLAAAAAAGSFGPATLALAVGWIAFGETVGGAGRMAMGAARRRNAQAALDALTAPTTPERPTPPYRRRQPKPTPRCAAPRQVRIDPLTLRTPKGQAFGETPAITLTAGAPAALVGASGAGKTTLLKTMAGWIGDAVSYDGAAPDAAAARAATHLALHDAAVVDADWRRNLFAPQADDQTLWAALDAVELRDRITTAGGLDARIDPQGGLSLGERQRIGLARAWLSPCGVVLIDEPSEHLDRAQGPRILAKLLDRLSDRVVVFATHDPDCAALAAETIRL